MTTPDKPEGKTSDYGLLLMNASNIPGYLTELKRKADFADELAVALEVTIRDGGLIHAIPEQAMATLKRYKG